MKSIARRLLALEDRASVHTKLAIVLLPLGPCVNGFQIGGAGKREEVMREPGESDEQLTQRAVARSAERFRNQTVVLKGLYPPGGLF